MATYTWRKVVTESGEVGSGTISQSTTGSATSFSGILDTSQGGTGVNLSGLGAGLLYYSGVGTALSVLSTPSVGEVLGNDNGTLGWVSVADSHVHDNYVQNNVENQTIVGNLSVNGHFDVTGDMTVGSLTIDSNAGDIFTVNSGNNWLNDEKMGLEVNNGAGTNAQMVFHTSGTSAGDWKMGMADALKKISTVEDVNATITTSTEGAAGDLAIDAENELYICVNVAA